MTDRSVIGDARPMSLAEVESLAQATHFGSDRGFHKREISDLLLANQATYCYSNALALFAVENLSITAVLAKNLAALMSAAKLSQSDLARVSGIKQRTISLYLRPGDRIRNVTKVPPSPTLKRVAQLAHALNVEPWVLLHPELELAYTAQAVITAAQSRQPPKQAPVLHEPAPSYGAKKSKKPHKRSKKSVNNVDAGARFN